MRDWSWMAPLPNVPWELKKGFWCQSAFQNFFTWVPAGRKDPLKICLLGSSFLERIFPFGGYGQTGHQCAGPACGVTRWRRNWKLLSCWHLHLICTKLVVRAWRKNILHSFFIYSELFCRIFSLKPTNSVLLEEKTLRVRKPSSRPGSGEVWPQVNCLLSLVLNFFVPRMVLE